MEKFKYKRMIGWLFLPLLFSCTSGKQISQTQFDRFQDNCVRTTPQYQNWTAPDLQPALTDKELARFTRKSWQMAGLLHVKREMNELMTLEEKRRQQANIEDQIRWLELKQQITDKINLASLEISAIAAELDCEEERADQLKGLLQEKMDKAERRITVAAILTGATTGLLVGALNLSKGSGNLSEEIGIAGGIAEATLGFLSLRIKRNHLFNHPKNHLNDVWMGPDSTANFPPVVWYYLNLPFETGSPSLRASLKQQWMLLDQLSLTEAEKTTLYFGAGGIYDIGDLDNRSSMLDQLEATITLMKKDLQLITKELIEGKAR